MGRATNNRKAILALQGALESFLNDHRRDAEKDVEWIAETKKMSAEERLEESGCGCDDCELAGLLLGRI